MALFATLERDSNDQVKLTTLAHLAADMKERVRGNPGKPVSIVLYGYLTTIAASDAVKDEIERNLMGKSLSAITKTLVQYGVPIDKIFIGEMVYSAPKARKIDIFLQQQGEPAPNLPANPPIVGKSGVPSFPKPAKDAELSFNNQRQLLLEVTAFKVSSGRRTLVPEISFKSNTGISPVEISKGVSAQLTMWKPRLEGLLKKIGQEGLADKIEFAVKITAGGGLTKEFARQVSLEVAASLQAALTFNITIPGTKREMPIELSYSYGTDFSEGRITQQGQGMIKITLLRFNSW